ncbi:MAG: hypothetical protein HN922_08040 [Anaerolineae bacterium]|nr:hypothetical protein [Anaerolineae bacterium]
MKHIATTLLLLLLVSCQADVPVSEEVNIYQTVSIKQEFPEVLMLAQSWSEDALLFRVSVPVINPNALSIRVNSEYVFESPTNLGEQFVVFCESTKCNSKIYEPNALFMDYGVEAINLDDVRVDSIEAVKIALRNGGDNHIKNSSRHGDVTLGRNKEGTLHWVGYFSGENGTIYIYIDPESGKVTEIDD